MWNFLVYFWHELTDLVWQLKKSTHEVEKKNIWFKKTVSFFANFVFAENLIGCTSSGLQRQHRQQRLPGGKEFLYIISLKYSIDWLETWNWHIKIITLIDCQLSTIYPVHRTGVSMIFWKHDVECGGTVLLMKMIPLATRATRTEVAFENCTPSHNAERSGGSLQISLSLKTSGLVQTLRR